MKLNKLGALVLAGVMAFSVAACGSSNTTKVKVTNENVKTVLKDAKNKLTKVNEVGAQMTLDIGLGTGDVVSEGVNLTTIKDVKKPVFKEIQTTSFQDGVEAESHLEVYIKEDGGKTYLYTPYEGEWYKQEIESYYVGYLFSQYYVTENAVKLIDNIDNISVTGESDGLYEISCQVPVENVFSLVDGTGAFSYLFESMNQAFFNITKPVDAKIWIDETGMVSKYQIDYTSALQDVFNTIYSNYGASLSSTDLKVSKYMITVEMSDFDALGEIDLPDYAKNAEEFEQIGEDILTIE